MARNRSGSSSADLVVWCQDYLDIQGTVKGSFSPNTAKATALEVMQLRDPWSDPADRRVFFGTIARFAAQAFIDNFDALKQARRAAKKAFGGSSSRPVFPAGDLRQMLDSVRRVPPASDSTMALVLYVGFSALVNVEPEGIDSIVEGLDEPRRLAVRHGRDWALTFHGDEEARARFVDDVSSTDRAPWGAYRRASAFFALLAVGWWRPEARPTRALITSIAEAEPDLLAVMLRSLEAWRRG